MDNNTYAVNYQDALDLCECLRGELAIDRPDAKVVPTCNPGTKQNKYVMMICRVYSQKNPLKFEGYLEFRSNEVYFRKRDQELPVLSSVAFYKGEDYQDVGKVKVHFCPDKVLSEDPNLYQDAEDACNNDSTLDLSQEIGIRSLRKAYAKLKDLVDGKAL